MRHRNRGLLIVGLIALGATGCELLVDFDRSKIDGGVSEVGDAEPDGELPDVQPAPDSGADVANPKDSGGDAGDATAPDTGTADGGEDSGAPDSGETDTGTQDSGTSDTGAPDSGTADSGTPDTGTSDTGAPDTGTPDTGAPDTGAPDTGTPDTGAPDTGPADTGAPDTGAPDTGVDAGDDATTGTDAGQDSGGDTGPAGCNDLSLTGVSVVTSADSTATPPTFAGGTVPATGTFVLTDVTYYISAGNPSGHAGETNQQIARTSGTTTFDMAANYSFGFDQSTYALSSPSSGVLMLSGTCGIVPEMGTFQYLVVGSGGTGTQLIISPDGVNYVRTFTQQ